MMKVCITGGQGKLAQALVPYFPYADVPGRDRLDVADTASCRKWLSERTYDLIIHTAAQTAHDASPAAYAAVNIHGTGNIAHWARKQGARLVYTSTDYVYPVQGLAPHRETDGVLPVNSYAWSKLGGECVAQLYDQSLIIRGSWYQFLNPPSATTDGFTSKVHVDRAASWIATLSQSTVTGIMNLGGQRRSLYEIVVTECDPTCKPISRKELRLPYQVPHDSSVDTTRMRQVVGR